MTKWVVPTSGDRVPGGAVGDAALLVELVVAGHVTREVRLGHVGVGHGIRFGQGPGQTILNVLSPTTNITL